MRAELRHRSRRRPHPRAERPDPTVRGRRHRARRLGARSREWRPAVPGNFVAGRLIGTTQLSSRRFVLIDDGLGFSPVPWRPALEQYVGRHTSGVVREAGGVDWSFGRKRGLGLRAIASESTQEREMPPQQNGYSPVH